MGRRLNRHALLLSWDVFFLFVDSFTLVFAFPISSVDPEQNHFEFLLNSIQSDKFKNQFIDKLKGIDLAPATGEVPMTGKVRRKVKNKEVDNSMRNVFDCFWD